jgi:hypothetical protein
MWNKITNLIGQYLGSVLNVINFQGSAYVNLWSLSLLILSVWVCVKTRSIPVSVSMIFSSIIVAYGAHKVSSNLSGKGKQGDDNDNSTGNSN